MRRRRPRDLHKRSGSGGTTSLASPHFLLHFDSAGAMWSAVRGAGEEGVEFVKTAIPTYREELSSDAARALPDEGEHC